jgi:hypothetical protein
MTNEQIQAKDIEALLDSLGTVDMVRFLQQTDHGWGDYTRDRHRRLGDQDVDQIVSINSQCWFS